MSSRPLTFRYRKSIHLDYPLKNEYLNHYTTSAHAIIFSLEKYRPDIYSNITALYNVSPLLYLEREEICFFI